MFYDNQVALKLYSNRPEYTRGQDVIISEALTGGSMPVNATVVMSLEDPSGMRIYSETKQYKPVLNDFTVRFRETVDSSWNNGVYVADSSMYAESGELLSTDKQVFSVCQESATVLVRPVLYGSSVQIINKTPEFSSRIIQIRDAQSLDIVAENQGTGSQSTYNIPLRIGSYFLTGYFTEYGGNVSAIEVKPLSVSCGEKKEVVVRVHNLTTNTAGGSQ
jgi:hypothetical protein